MDNNKGREDPIFFINEFLGIPLHDGQIRYLREAEKAIKNDGPLIRRFVLSCANRWGKSTMIACLQLWYLFYKFGIKTNSPEEWFDIEYRTANIAPYSSLTEPVFKAMKAIMTSTYPVPNEEGKLLTNKCKIEDFYLPDRTLNTPPYKLFFANNSYIEHLSLQGGKGDNLQGKPYGLITYDEASRSDHLQVELDNSVLGRLLDWTAPLHLLSTPDSDSSSLLYYKQLYDEGLVGLNSSYTQTGEIYENTFFTPTQIQEQEDMLKNNPLRNQMLKGEFIFGTNNLFHGQDIIDALDQALADGVRYEEGHKYAIGIDTAIGSDEMVYEVLDYTEKPFRLVRELAAKGNSKSPQMHLNDFLMLINEYQRLDDSGQSNVYVMLETFNGESVRFYHDLPPSIRSFTRCYGSWKPPQAHIHSDNPIKPTRNEVKKADLLVNLKKLLSAHEIKLPRGNHRLLQQLSIYKEDDKKIPTDRTIALALACFLAEDMVTQREPEFVAIEW
jgi:hypothetical protein